MINAQTPFAAQSILTIEKAFTAEGKIVDGQCIVPADFFIRLNAKLNEGRKTTLDDLIRMMDAE